MFKTNVSLIPEWELRLLWEEKVHLYEFLNVLSDGENVKKTFDKEYNWMVSPLYEFLNVLSDGHIVQKTLDKEYN